MKNDLSGFKKEDLIWLGSHYCVHGHKYIEHLPCFFKEKPDGICELSSFITQQEGGREMDANVLELLKKRQVPIHQYYGDVVRFGVISDTHMGSIYEHQDVLNLAYKVFKKEGIEKVYHAGDLCDGEGMWHGHAYEIHTAGADAQVKLCVEKYPKFKGVTTYFISGSHDLSFFKRAGVDIGNLIASKRKDLVYLGQEEADIWVKARKGKVIMRLSHPGGGSAYSISYHPQKYIESLSGGQKPNILLIGHYHKAFYLPCYRNVFTLLAGTIEGQTGFMRRKNLAAHMGFWIVEFRIDKDGSVMRFQPEFFAHYEKRVIKGE